MTMTDNFDGIVGAGSSLSVTTPTPVTVPIQGLLEFTPPARQYKKATYTPLSGTNAGKERILLCSEQAGTIEVTALFEATRAADIDAICGVNLSTITLTLSDGTVYSGTGGIEKGAVEHVTDSKEITISLTIALDAGYTFTAGAGGGTAATHVPTYAVKLSGTTGLVDLRACGALGTTTLTGKKLTSLTLTALSDNGGAITVAKGASNGYDIGGSFSETLVAGESVTLTGTSASDTVGDTKYKFDVSGTSGDSVQLTITAVVP